MKITGLFIYPIKSCAPLALEEMHFSATGPWLDRHFMVVKEGNFLTQRQYPELSLVQQSLKGKESLVLRAPQMEELKISLSLKSSESKTATVWEDSVLASNPSSEANQWFSEYLKEKVELVAQEGERKNEKKGLLSFVDSYQVHICNEKSLAELNQRLQEPVAIERFRPNIVIDGLKPYEEDSWKEISFSNGAKFTVLKGAPRCSIITVNPDASMGQEPLKTLASYRREGSKVLFGQYLKVETAKTLRLGEPLKS